MNSTYHVGRGEAARLSVGFYTSISAGNLLATLVDYQKRFSQIDVCLKESSRARLVAAVPVENQIRTYSWCNPPRIGRQRMRPALFTVRDRGASLSKAKCVRVSL